MRSTFDVITDSEGIVRLDEFDNFETTKRVDGSVAIMLEISWQDAKNAVDNTLY